MNRFYAAFAILIILLLIFRAPVANAETLLTEALLVEKIKLRHPGIRAAEADRTAQQSEVRQSLGAFDPIIRGQVLRSLDGPYGIYYTDLSVEQNTSILGSKWVAGYRRGLGSYPVYDEKMRTNEAGEFRAGLEVPLLRNLLIDERRARFDVQAIGSSAANETLLQSEQEVLRAGLIRYWDWVAAGKKLELNYHLLKIAEERDEFLGERIKAGDAPRIELMDNQRVMVQRQSLVVGAERALQKAALELSMFLWDENGKRTIPEKKTLPKDWGVWKSALTDEEFLQRQKVESVPEAKIQRFSVLQREIELRLARNQILPRLDVSTTVSRDYGLGPLKANDTEWRVGLTLEFPLLFNTSLGRKEQAFARLVRSEMIEQLTVERLWNQRIDLAQAVHAIESRLSLAKDEVKLADKLEDLETERFLHGDSSILIVNLREQATLEAELKLLDLNLELKRSQIDIEFNQAKLGSQ